MNSKEIFAIGFICLIAIIIPVAIVLSKQKDSSPNNPRNAYSVTPDTSAYSNSLPVAVTSLTDAQNRCYENNNCKSFVYSEVGKTMTIVDLKSSKFSKPGVHLFTIQMGVDN